MACMALAILKLMRRLLGALRNHYALMLERELTLRQTVLLLNAQLSFVFAVFPMGGPLLLRALCGAWFVHALLKCKAEL